MKFDKSGIEKAVQEKAKAAAQKKLYDVECPHCHTKLQFTPGEHPCSSCGKLIKLTLNFN